MVRFHIRRRGGDSNRPMGVMGRLGLSLFFLFFLGMGLMFTAFVVGATIKIVRTYAWTPTPCTIVRSEVAENPRGSSENPYALEIAYEYAIGGRTLTGGEYTTNSDVFDSWSEADEVAQRYPVGSQHTCYVNADQPQEAILKRSSPLIGLFILIPLVFVAIGGGGLVGTWRPRKAGQKEAIKAKPVRRKKCGPRVAAGFFLIFFVIGAAVLYPIGIRPILRIEQAKSWVETPCRIENAFVKSHSSDDGTTYSVYILYSYEYGGQRYKADRRSFFGGSSSGYDGKREVVEQYKRDPRPVCYVNPENPREAVLERGYSWGVLFGLIPVAFMTVGLVGVIGSVRSARKKGRPDKVEWLPETRASTEPQNVYAPAGAARGSGPVELRPKHGPVAKFLGFLLFALFWNGIVSVFVTMAVRGFMRGRPEWFLAIFMVPFVLIGLLVIGLAVHQFLAIFNPRPKLTLSRGEIPLGGTAELSWEVFGRSQRIRELKVTLIGMEQARYQRGTKTVTAKNVFYEMELVKTEEPKEIAYGSVGLIVPPDTMHSFEADNNKILWSLKMQADVPRWPDVEAEFPITVAPQAMK